MNKKEYIRYSKSIISDERIITTLKEMGGTSTAGELSDKLGLHDMITYKRLNTLRRRGVLRRITPRSQFKCVRWQIKKAKKR